MSEKELDCRGLACPNPVLKTKELLDQGEVTKVTVMVDNRAAQENVSRLLTHSGYRVDLAEVPDALLVTGHKSETMVRQLKGQESEVTRTKKILVLLGTDRLGRGDNLLGQKLITSFLATLKEMGRDLWCLVLLNAGVKLAVAGSEDLASLQELEKEGVMILVCGTCLNHFNLLEQKRVGETTNMLDIVTHMQLADKVIPLT